MKRKVVNRLDPKAVAKRLRALRGDMTQQDLAVALGVTDAAVGMWERAERMPRDEIKERYAEVFGQSVQEIFFAESATKHSTVET